MRSPSPTRLLLCPSSSRDDGTLSASLPPKLSIILEIGMHDQADTVEFCILRSTTTLFLLVEKMKNTYESLLLISFNYH